MIQAGFSARPDIVGERIALAWGWRFEHGEGPADVPHVAVRRKRRDFEFPAGDEFVIFDTAAFPVPARNVRVTPIDLGTTAEGAGYATTLVDSVARDDLGDSGWREVLRRTTTTSFSADGVALGQRVVVHDFGLGENAERAGLEPGVSYYYELRWEQEGARKARDSARAGGAYGAGRVLYDQLPEVHRRHDTISRPDVRTAPGLLEAAPRSGQLRRFLDLFGAGLDALRSSADGLRTLHDVHEVDYLYLPLLAHSLGWRLDVRRPIPDQRHQIRYAAQLYRMTGTVPGVLVWVKRLTGWDAELREFGTNVMISNDLGNPDDVRDTGSRTVDTGDPALLERLGTAADEVDYTYDSGVGSEDRYAFNVVGIFVEPEEPPEEIARKRARLLANTGLFLPLNMRAVVIVDAPTLRRSGRAGADLRDARDEP